MSSLRLRALIGAALLLAATPALADAPRVAVVTSMQVNIDDARALAIEDQLAAALRSELVVDVLAGADARRRLPAGPVPASCPADAACVRDLGERLEAEQILFLSLVELAGTLQIDPTWVEVASGEVRARPSLSIAGDVATPERFARAAIALLPGAARREPEPPAPELALTSAPPRPRASRGRRMTPGAWVAAGSTGVALAGGIGFALAARRSEAALAEDGCAERACDPARVDALERRVLAADLLFGAAVLGAGATALLYAFSTDDESLQVTPAAGPHGAGVAVGGRF